MTEITHTCETCRHWLRSPCHRHEVALSLGVCGRVPDFSYATAAVEGAKRDVRPEYADRLAFVRSTDLCRLLTKADFGCNQWVAQKLGVTPC